MSHAIRPATGGKHPFCAFLTEIAAPQETQSGGGELGKEWEPRSWRPRYGSPGTLEGSRQARPFPGLAAPHTRIPQAFLTHLELARTGQARISGPRRRESSERTSAGLARRRAERAGAALRSAPGRGPAGNRLPPTPGPPSLSAVCESGVKGGSTGWCPPLAPLTARCSFAGKRIEE